MTSGEEIIKLMRERNESGLSLLFDRYSPSIFGLLKRMLHDHETAEEVLQTAFLKAWDRIDRYDENKASLHTWLYAIARNAALDVIRLKSFERNAQSVSLEETTNQGASVYIATEGIDTSNLLSRIEAKYRDVLDCLYLQGYSQSETAEKLNIPLGTVKSRLRVGIKTIRTHIGPEKGMLWSLIILIILTLLLWS